MLQISLRFIRIEFEMDVGIETWTKNNLDKPKMYSMWILSSRTSFNGLKIQISIRIAFGFVQIGFKRHEWIESVCKNLHWLIKN